MKRLLRLLLIGIVTFAVCAAALAPASLLRFAVRDAQPLTLGALTGTVWHGSGDLGFDGTPLGRLNWSFAPGLLLNGQMGFVVDLHCDGLDAAGTVGAAPTAATAQLHGTIDAALLKEPLARYAIEVPGSLAVDDLDVTHRYGDKLPTLHGNLKWSGGTINYRMSGQNQRVKLPPLAGLLDETGGQPTLTVSEIGGTTPLLIGHLTEDGVASLGITKQFTKMLGQPWPGSEPDHAVVLEVGEKLC
jgi:Type II secretion system (T2SS), protein N